MAQTPEEKKAANLVSHRKCYKIRREGEGRPVRNYGQPSDQVREKHRQYNRKWIAEHPERDRAIKLKYKYGMLPGDYERMLAEQDVGPCGGKGEFFTC